MAEDKKKETRIMRVTMDADEFSKFDKGETYSAKGVRGKGGKLSALPDIAPVSESDLPKRTVYRTRYVERREPSLRQMIKRDIVVALTDAAVDAIADPRKRAIMARKVKRIWNEHVKPFLFSEKQPCQTKAERLLAESKQQASIIYQVETVNEQHERIVVSGEQAQQLITAMQQEAKRLASMIYILSNISIKDDKADEERILEQAYIRQLVSEEAMGTMRLLIEHRQLLGESTAACFEDWLKGYIRNGDQRIPIPAGIENGSHTAETKWKGLAEDENQ